MNASTPPATSQALHERLPMLDLMRFIAASAVVIYHMTYRPAEPHLFGSLQGLTKYGYLGVNLFFVISGFVILWSATGRTVPDYLISRIARLYPSFWVGILVTSATMFALRPERLQTLETIVANFTMVPGYLGAGYVDGVYWTLAIELKFYVLVLICLLLRQMNRIELWLWVWLLLTIACHTPFAPRLMGSLIIFPFGAFFIAGSMFYLTWRNGITASRAAALVLCLGLTSIAVVADRRAFMSDVTPASAWVVASFMCATFGLFAAVAMRKIGAMTSRAWFSLGALTYPLYLIHNQVGKAVFSALGNHVNEWVRLPIVLITIGAISWAMAAIVEQRASPTFRRYLSRTRNRIFAPQHAEGSGD